MTRIELHEDSCVSSGMCSFTAPDYFDQDQATGLAIVVKHDVREDDLADVDAAVTECPGAALSLDGSG